MDIITYQSVSDQDGHLPVSTGNSVVSLYKRADETKPPFMIFEEINADKNVVLTRYDYCRSQEDSNRYIITQQIGVASEEEAKNVFLEMINNEHLKSRSWVVARQKIEDLKTSINHQLNGTDDKAKNVLTDVMKTSEFVYPIAREVVKNFADQSGNQKIKAIANHTIVASDQMIEMKFLIAPLVPVATKLYDRFFGHTKSTGQSTTADNDAAYKWFRDQLLSLNENKISHYLPSKLRELFVVENMSYRLKA